MGGVTRSCTAAEQHLRLCPTEGSFGRESVAVEAELDGRRAELQMAGYFLKLLFVSKAAE